MKLDSEIIRDILLDIEELHEYPNSLIYSNPSHLKRASQYSNEAVAYHLKLLSQARFIEWSPTYTDNAIYISFINGITFDGHEFLNNIRHPKVWKQAKERTKKMGTFSLEVISQVAANIISDLLKNQF